MNNPLLGPLAQMMGAANLGGGADEPAAELFTLRDYVLIDSASSSAFSDTLAIGPADDDRWVFLLLNVVRTAAGTPDILYARIGTSGNDYFRPLLQDPYTTASRDRMGIAIYYKNVPASHGTSITVQFGIDTTARYAMMAAYSAVAIPDVLDTILIDTTAGSDALPDGEAFGISVSNSDAQDTTITGIENDVSNATAGTEHSASLAHGVLSGGPTVISSTDGELLEATSINAYDNFSANLLTNGDFETGDKTGWTEVAGVWTVSGASAGLGVIEGSWICGNGNASGHNEIAQTVDIPVGYGEGDRAVAISWTGRSFIDAGETWNMILEALNDALTVLSSVEWGEDAQGTDQWFNLNLGLDIPSGATKLRLRLTGQRTVGSFANIFFDDVILRVGAA